MCKISQGKFGKKERLNRSSDRKVMPILRRTLRIRFLLRSKLDRIDEYGCSRWGSHTELRHEVNQQQKHELRHKLNTTDSESKLCKG
jgi:hypothetical protein